MYVELKEQDYGGAHRYFLNFSQCQVSKMQCLLVQHAWTPLQLTYFIFVFIYLHPMEPYKGQNSPIECWNSNIYKHTQYKGIKTHKSKAPIIHQEYNRHNNCTKCNHKATEQLVTIICTSRVNNNKGDDFYDKIKHDI